MSQFAIRRNQTFSIDSNNNRNLTESVDEALKLVGGLKDHINADDPVILKPNYNTGDPYPGSTDPSFLESIFSLLSKVTTNISIIESSMISKNTKNITSPLIGNLLHEYNASLITEKETDYISINLASKGAKYIKKVKFPQQIVNEENKIILLPCLKTHFIAEYSGALKLAVGYMERKSRIPLHTSLRVPEKSAEINLAYKPNLIIMDARKIFVTGGPAKGKTAEPGKILIGTNRTAIDIQGTEIIRSYNEKNKLSKYGNSREIRT
ncbi:MAG: DUF362 domain-containing protein, partial [Candidatus Kariarchaeaceae archaeon]